MTRRIALILAGGAARGAYEVGVVRYLVEDIARDLGHEVPIDILSGTSVGAINSTFLAAFADEPRNRATRLAAQWGSLRIDEVVALDRRGVADALWSLVGRTPPMRPGSTRRGGLFEATGIERIVREGIPFERIGENIRAGHLRALTLSATDVGTGRTTVFMEHTPGREPCPAEDPTEDGVATWLTADHVLASAAIPFLFPAVRIGGAFYCDGGLRQNVPLAPAIRQGATSTITVIPRHLSSTPPRTVTETREASFPGPFYLLGKALNSLLLDRIDNDLVQMARINKLLEAGTRSYGPSFADTINRALGVPQGEAAWRHVRSTVISASQDIGRIAADYVRSKKFEMRVSRTWGRVIQRIADASDEADLLSYLLFDGEFAGRLIELGRADARRHHAELAAMVVERLEFTAAAA